jgi:carbonic anhydrase
MRSSIGSAVRNDAGAAEERNRISMIPAEKALERLRRGNRRFVAEIGGRDGTNSEARRLEIAAGQEPLAIILGCSDSRVPAEIVFDQGLGDLFVIRVAGNIVAPSQIGSVEFAAERYSTRLVVVLGHSMCGAVLATLEELARPAQDQSRNLRSIVNRIRPSVQALLETDVAHKRDALVRAAVRANIRASASQLRHGSQLLEHLILNDGLLVVGAEYSLETGLVDFFDGMPAVDDDPTG